ncbi:hypothetical protein [Paenibacillus sp. LjRoot56]|uniref:hypothetical protein n=1 Tax=Paenibacillus sp. LjRoot56 TaxID=3342333 RepID=UPI003ED0554C
MDYKLYSVREILLQLGHLEKDLQASEDTMDVYVTISQLNGGIEGIQLASVVTYRLAKLKRIKTKTVVNGKMKYDIYHLNDAAQYILERNLFLDEVKKGNLLTFDKILRYFGNTGKDYLGSKYIEHFKKFDKKNLLKLILLGERIYPFPKTFFFVTGESFNKFIEEYMSIQEAMNELGVSRNIFFRDFPGEIINLFNERYNYRFIKRNDLSLFQRKVRVYTSGYKRKTVSNNSTVSYRVVTTTKSHINNKLNIACVSKKVTKTTLSISIENLEKTLKNYHIVPISSANYIAQIDLDFLVTEQSKQIDDYSALYILSNEIKEKYNISHAGKKFKWILPPPLICVKRANLDWSGTKFLYLKTDITQYLEYKQNKKAIRLDSNQTGLIYSTVDSQLFHSFLTIIDQLNISFSNDSQETKAFWYKYVERKLAKSSANAETKSADVSKLLKITELFIRHTADKEIFSYSINELNLLFFNDMIQISYQQEIRFFLSTIKKALLKKGIDLKISNLRYDPSTVNDKSTDKDIYSIENYIQLLDYVGNIKLHKLNAINDIRNFKSNYYHYSSSWLYVLLHLNNAWRHYDVTLFPRIDLNHTKISSLEWLQANEISREDAQRIVAQIKSMNLIHSKTGKIRYFFCSDELLLPFANAAAICELRCRLYEPFSDCLIDFKSNANASRIFKIRSKKRFFFNMIENLNFESLKMNRTIISYMYNVIKKVTNRNPLEITKFIRSHSDEEVNNIYLILTQEHLDFLTRQLFNTGHFGYIYDLLGEILFNDSPLELEEKASRSLILKDTFGDIFHVERMAGLLRALLNERTSVSNILNELHPEKTKSLLNLIKLGQQPAKEDGYQCIFTKCKYPEKSCGKCQCSIPNIYALSKLGIVLNKRIEEYKQKFDTGLIGDRTRIANLLYSELSQLKEAINKFGEHVVSEFLEGGIETLREKLSLLPSGIQNLTMK